MFTTGLYRPGYSPSSVPIVLDDVEYVIDIPDTYTLLDIAASYAWPQLLPGCLTEDSRSEMLERINDADNLMTLRRLHVVVQPIGTYLYGWPFFVASRALRIVRTNESYFRAWALTNIHISLDAMSPADWTSASVAWQMSMAQKEEERNATWAELTTPSRLPEIPIVMPGWMSA